MARKRTGLNACGGYKYNGNTYTAQELFNMLKDGELENLVKEGKITINPEDMPLLAEKYQGIEAASNKQPVEPMANTGFKEGDVVHFRFRGKAQTVQSKAKIEQVIEKDGVPAFVKLEGINKQIPITDISTQPFGGVEEAKKAEAKKEEVVAKTRFEKAKERGIAIVNAINATKAKVYSFVDEKVLEQSGWTKKSVMDFQKAFNNAFNSTKLGNKRLGKDVQIVLMNNSQMLDWVAENQPQAYKSAVAGKLDIKGVLVNPEGTLVIINVDKASNTTPLHEIAGHIWEMWAKKNAKPLYQAMIKKVGETKYFAMLTKAQDMLAEGKSLAQVMQSLKNTKEFKSIFADKKATEGFLDLMQYITHGVNSKLSRAAIDDVLRSEIFAKVIETNAEILASHEDKSVMQSFKDFIAELFKKLSEVTGFKGLNYKALGEMDINQFAQAVLSELSKGELSTDIARKVRVAEAGMAEEATESQIIPEATKRGQNVTEEEEFEVNETTAKEEPQKIDDSEQEESVKEVTIEDAMNVIAESDEPNIYESMDVAEAAKMAMGKIPYVGRLFEYATKTLLKSKDEAKRAEAAELMDNPKVFLNSRLEDLKAAEQTEETTKEITEIESAIAEIDRINALVESANKVLTTFGADGEVVSNVSAFSFIRSTPESILKPLLELVTKTQFFQDAKEVDITTNPADILEGILTQRYTLSKEDRAIMGSIVEGPLKKFWDYHTAKLKSEDEFITSAKLQELFKKEYNKSVKTSAERETKRKIKSAKYKITKQAQSVFKKVKDLERQLGDTTKDLSGEQKAAMRAEINELLKDFSKYSIASRELDHLAYDSFFYEDMNNAFGIEQFGEEGFYRILASMPYTRGKYVETTNLVTTNNNGKIVSSHNLKSEAGNVLATFEITKNLNTNEGHISFMESDKMFGDPKATKEAFIAATRMLQMDGFTPVIDQYLTGQTYDSLKRYAAEGLLVENKLAPKEEPFGPQDEIKFYGIPPFQYNFKSVLTIEPQDVTPRQLSLFQFGAKHGTHTLFDKFNSKFIGTGEGAQAFGWGLYFTDLESIAKQYAKNVSKDSKNIEINDKQVPKELTDLINYFLPFFKIKLNAISSKKELGEKLVGAWDVMSEHLTKDWNTINDAQTEYRKKIRKFAKENGFEDEYDLGKYLEFPNLDFATLFGKKFNSLYKNKDKVREDTTYLDSSVLQDFDESIKALKKPEGMSDKDFVDAVKYINDVVEDHFDLDYTPKFNYDLFHHVVKNYVLYKKPIDLNNIKLIFENNNNASDEKINLTSKFIDFVIDNFNPIIKNLLSKKINFNTFNKIAGTQIPGILDDEFDVINGKFFTNPISNVNREVVLDIATKNIKNAVSELYGLDIDNSKPFSIKKSSRKGVLYSVIIHKDKTPDQYDYIQWHKPLTKEQRSKIKEKLNIRTDIYNISRLSSDLDNKRTFSGSELYQELTNAFGSPKEASLFLLDSGIDGIKYPVNYTTNPKENDFNYVVFDDNAVTIEEAMDLDRNPLFSFSTNNLEDDFYYPLEKRLTEMKDEVKTAKQWGDILKGGDEVEFSNIPDYLNSFKPEDKVNKSDILNYFNENKPKFTVDSFTAEKLDSNVKKQADKVITEYNNEVLNLVNEYMASEEFDDSSMQGPEDIYYALSDDLYVIKKKYLYELNIIGFSDATVEDEIEYFDRIEDEVISDEDFDKFPRKIILNEFKGSSSGKQNEQESVFFNTYSENIQSGPSENYTITTVSYDKEDLYRSGHFNKPNVLVHVRTTIRKDKKGEKVLFLEETQSDWGQEGRKGFFKSEKGMKDYEKFLAKVEDNKKLAKEKIGEIVNTNAKFTKNVIDIVENLYESIKDKGYSNVIQDISSDLKLTPEYIKANKEYIKLFNQNAKDLSAIYPEYDFDNTEGIRLWFTPYGKQKKYQTLYNYLVDLDYITGIKTIDDLLQHKNLKDTFLSRLSGFHGERNNVFYTEREIEKHIPQVTLFEDAPFIKETSAWAKLGVKIAMQQAVKNGCTRIAWTTGEQQDKVNGKKEPVYHKFYGSPKLKELGTLGNIFKKVAGVNDEKIEITNINFGKNNPTEVYSISINNDMIEKTYQGMPMFSLGAPQTNAAVAPGSQTATPAQTVNNVGVTPNTAQVPALNAQQQGHINNIANSYRNLNPYTQISFQPFQPENKTILSNVNSFITRKTVASLGLGTEYLLAKESMVGYEANQKSELEKETKAALALLSSPKYADEPSMKGMTAEAKLNLINLALSGDPIAFNVLPADFQPVITGMRNRIDALSEAMIRSGWLKLSTAEAFDKGLGNHLRRQFKKFTLKEKAWEKFANNLDPAVRERAIRGFYTWVQEGFYQEPQTMAGYVPLYDRWKEYNKDEKAANKLETRLNALNSRLALKQQQLPQRQNQQQAQATIAKIQKDIADVTAQLNPLQAKLAAEFPVLDAATYDLAEKGLQDLLDAPETSSSLNPYTGSQIQMATLKKRLTEAEFPEWMRDVYGEIKDPVMNYQMTVSNLVNMTSRMKFLNDVYTLAKGDGFIYNDVQLSAKEREQLKKDGWVNIDGTNEGTPQTRFGPFIGTWVKPELYEFAFGTDAEISTIYSVRGWVLIGKTAGNLLFGPIRNFFGNGSFLLVNGSATKFFANLKNGVSKSDFEYMKSLPGKNLGSKFYNFWDTAIDDAEKLGLFQTVNTDWAKETFNKISKDTVLMKAFEKSEAEGWSYFYKNYVCNLGRWVKDGAVQSYIWADILPKLTSFTTSRNHLANKLAVAAGLPSGLSYNTLANPNPAHPLYNEIISKIKPEQMAQINRMAGHQTNVSMVTSDRVAPIVANMPKKTIYKGKSIAGKGAAATKDALTLIFGGDFPRFVAESMRIFLQQLGNVATINKTYESKAFKVFENEKENSEFLKSLNVEQRAHTLAGLIGWSGVMSQVVPYFGGLGASLLAMVGLGGGDDDDSAETDNNQSVQVSTKPGFTTEGFMNKNRNLGAEMYRLYQAKVNGGMSIDEALREVSREFEQNHQLDFKLLGDGKFMRQDVSSVDPFAVFTAIPRSIMYRPERGFYNKLTGGISSLYDEYLGVEMGVSLILDLVKNQNPYTGLPIYNEEADFFGKKGAAMLYHSMQTLPPTFITKSLKMYEKSQDKVNQRTGEVTEGKPLDKQMLIELQSAAYGRTYYEENPRKLLHNLIKPLYSGKSGAVRQKTYFKDLDILKDVCYKMNRKVQAMRTLGMKEDEIAEVLGDIIREDSIWEAAFYGGSYIDNLELDENND